VSLLLKAVGVEDDHIHRRIFLGSGVCRLPDALEIGQKDFTPIVGFTKYGKRCSGDAGRPLPLSLQDHEGQEIPGRDSYRRRNLKIFVHCEHLVCSAGIEGMAARKNQYRARSTMKSGGNRNLSDNALARSHR